MPRERHASPTSTRRKPTARSAVTNGGRLHVVKPKQSAWARRFRDILAEIVDDLGGFDTLSEGQRQLARRAATLSIECERLEGEAVSGRAIDLNVYGQLTDRIGRTFRRLGMHRIKRREDTPSLRTYLSAKADIESDPR